MIQEPANSISYFFLIVSAVLLSSSVCGKKMLFNVMNIANPKPEPANDLQQK
jgi:hypothetical protein